MLERLSVRGLGIIDEVTLEFASGFAVLTGETGAGKSLLVESLKLLSGQRSNSDMVRTGDDRLQVEGVFWVSPSSKVPGVLEELGVEGAETVVLRREVADSGRGRCWINDQSVTANALQQIAPQLLAIHGQHEQHGLADGGVQRRMVDDYGGHGAAQEATRAAYRAWLAAAEELERLLAARASRRDRLDVITFQLAEIDAVDPHDGEDDDLRRRRLALRHAARIAELTALVLEQLADGEAAASDSLARAEREIAELAELGLSVDDGVARLAAARVQVEEVVREVQDLAAAAGGEPGELEDVESRLHQLDQLMLKYGPTICSVLDHRESLVKERLELESVEERVEGAKAAEETALRAFDRAAVELAEARRAAGAALAEAVEGVLARLAMGGTRLAFSWDARSDASSRLLRDGAPVAFDENGVEECTLLIAANPGEELRPMARIASGGELSRVHLALRTALRSRHPAGGLTLLFDEVDSGLGGATAAALADLLAELSVEDQVLVVTHLPQVAARGSGHFRVEKVVVDGRAVTRVSFLQGEQREAEVARMLAGDELTESARTHARVLLEGK